MKNKIDTVDCKSETSLLVSLFNFVEVIASYNASIVHHKNIVIIDVFHFHALIYVMVNCKQVANTPHKRYGILA